MSKHGTNEFSHLVSQTLDSETSSDPNEISNVIFVQCMIEKNCLKAPFPKFELEGVGFDFSGLIKESCGDILPGSIAGCLIEKLGIPKCYLGFFLNNGCYYLAISKSKSDLAEALRGAPAKNLAA